MEKEQLLEQLNEKFDARIKEATKGTLKQEDLTKLSNEYAALQTKNSELEAKQIELLSIVEKQGLELKKMKDTPVSTDRIDRFKSDLSKWIETEEVQEFMKSPSGSKQTPKLNLKYSIASNHSGTVLVSSGDRSQTYDSFVPRRIHVRDLLPVLPTDQTTHVWDKVTSYTPGIDTLAENGTAAAFAYSTTEQTASVVRVGGYIDISDNALRSTPWVTNHIARMAPAKLQNIEDFQLLFGDGGTNQIHGIYNQSTTMSLTGPSFSAGDFASISTYDSNAYTKITFTNAHGLSNAYILTLAATTGATYDGAHQVIVVDEKNILIDQNYTADANVNANWTGTSVHYLADKVDNAQEYDVLISAAAYMANSEYQLTAYVLNPGTVAKIDMLKATDSQYVGKIGRGADGVYRISGIPVIEHNSMPADRFLGGDFQMAAELLQYEGMSVQFIKDATLAIKNQTRLYISEQILLAVTQPFMFVSGQFATIAAALETP